MSLRGGGAGILARHNVLIKNIVCLPTGWGMAADFQNVTLFNIYAPSGAKRRRHRENSISN